MATIRTAISLYDGVSGPLRTMHRAMNVVMDSFEALNTASSGAIDVSSIRQARAELSGVMSDFSRTEEQIRNADDAQNELNSSIRGGSSAADTLLGRFKSLVATVGGLAAIKGSRPLGRTGKHQSAPESYRGPAGTSASAGRCQRTRRA